MSKQPPERVTVSIPEDSDLDRDRLDRLRDVLDADNTSDAVRQAVLDVLDREDGEDC